MIADGERRDVAEALRDMAMGCEIRYAEQFYELLTGDVLYGRSTRSYRETAELLADLIEPRRCSVVDFDGTERCSQCGRAFKGLSRHCPNCGAEVTEVPR